MIFWLLVAIVLYYVQVFLPATFKFFQVGVSAYLGSRDDEAPLTGVPARLERATINMRENFPVFAVLAAALLAVGQGDNGQAILGAQIFVIARALYIPLYAMAVPLVRSLAAVAGWVGLIYMAVALAGSIS